MTATLIRSMATLAATVAAGAGLLFASAHADADTGAPSCGPGQFHVTSVITANSAATICQWKGDGRFEYRGVGRQTGNAITLPVAEVHQQENGSGNYYYVAYNNGYTYRLFVDLGLSIVGPDGRLVSSEPAI
ncbi:hypothetical protein QSJ18_17655 [Gordonia sp. ABSL1-1]|uniref:hypothetical protein n=1 Tax=Gordonia sp. ABSL1-1 TaxID=3053923 RepID=UPI002573CA19|nr:hypothetical protein [Gordonia sp. ABSL1-1]MDL9938575.1 hypothetical protein [Gordonia sp. ABSL1-1]